MRTLGDMRWINDYVGLSYELGGRGPDHFDCYGLCALVYREQFDIDLPDWNEAVLELKGRALAFEGEIHSGTWTELQEPEDGCFVICYRTKAAHHMGVYFAGGVLHAARGVGSVFEPLPRFQNQYGKVIFGRWAP